MASATDRLMENQEDVLSRIPSPDYVPNARRQSSHNSRHQSIAIPPNVSHRPLVESPTEAPSSLPMTFPNSQTSQTSRRDSEISPSRRNTANLAQELDAEQTSYPLLTPSLTQETIKPATSQSDNRRESSASSYLLAGLEKVKSKFSPDDHNAKAYAPIRWSTGSSYDSGLQTTARPYKHKRQTWRLWRLSLGEFLVTTVLCLLYLITVTYYAQKDMMYPSDQAWFNGLSQCIIFLLGVSIAASFRSYAKLLRWRILAFRYRSLETFDLVLACDSLVNVFKLLWRAGRKGPEEKKYMRYMPTLIQFVCACWIVLKVTALFLVGYAGSLASLDAGPTYIGRDLADTNTTSFAVLGGIDNDAKLSRMQTWASRGFRYNGSQGIDYASARMSTFSTLRNGTAAYWPKVFDTADSTNQAVSFRQIRADAVCVAYTVTDGQFGNQSFITYIDDDGKPTNFSFPNYAQPQAGGFLASSHIQSTCGPRCINVDAFLAQTVPGNPIVKAGRKTIISYTQAKFYKCNNTIGPVLAYDGDGNLTPAPAQFALSDSWAQMAAGAIGWQSEITPVSASNSTDNKRPAAMFIPYPALSEMGTFFATRYPNTPNATNMADMVASVPMLALAAADDSTTGLKIFNTSTWYPPLRSQNLNVNVPVLIGSFGAIVFSQFMALVAVFIFANGAPIKDDSPISLAKFYHSFLRQHGFGEGGSLMKGKDIIDKIGHCNVKYGWAVREGEVRHIGILEEDLEQQPQDRRESTATTFGDTKVHYIYD